MVTISSTIPSAISSAALHFCLKQNRFSKTISKIFDKSKDLPTWIIIYVFFNLPSSFVENAIDVTTDSSPLLDFDVTDTL